MEPETCFLPPRSKQIGLDLAPALKVSSDFIYESAVLSRSLISFIFTMAFLSHHLLLLSLVSWASADCSSFGWDFVNGGGPYCVDTRSSEPFSFGSGFEGWSI